MLSFYLQNFRQKKSYIYIRFASSNLVLPKAAQTYAIYTSKSSYAIHFIAAELVHEARPDETQYFSDKFTLYSLGRCFGR